MPRTKLTRLERDILGFLKTFDRVEDEVIIAISGDDIIPDNRTSCICGRIVRNKLAALAGMPEDENGIYVQFDTGRQAHTLYGGTAEEWKALYLGVLPRNYFRPDHMYRPNTGKMRAIETAFVLRFEAALYRTRRGEDSYVKPHTGRTRE